MHRDTVYLTVVDKDRNVVSLINSVFASFGSGIYAPRSGVLLQNRGSGFSLKAGHPNELMGRKRPLHTIIPAMLMKDGAVQMGFGVMGGQFQAAGHISSPTCSIAATIRSAPARRPAVRLRGHAHPRADLRADRCQLAGLGHKVAWSNEPIGGCQAIWIDRQRGVLIGGSDHRKDGLALGY